jgi:hypothetical protein
MVSPPAAMLADQSVDRLAPSSTSQIKHPGGSQEETAEGDFADVETQSDIIHKTEGANFPPACGAAQYLISSR